MVISLVFSVASADANTVVVVARVKQLPVDQKPSFGSLTNGSFFLFFWKSILSVLVCRKRSATVRNFSAFAWDMCTPMFVFS